MAGINRLASATAGPEREAPTRDGWGLSAGALHAGIACLERRSELPAHALDRHQRTAQAVQRHAERIEGVRGGLLAAAAAAAGRDAGGTLP